MSSTFVTSIDQKYCHYDLYDLNSNRAIIKVGSKQEKAQDQESVPRHGVALTQTRQGSWGSRHILWVSRSKYELISTPEVTDKVGYSPSLSRCCEDSSGPSNERADAVPMMQLSHFPSTCGFKKRTDSSATLCAGGMIVHQPADCVVAFFVLSHLSLVVSLVANHSFPLHWLIVVPATMSSNAGPSSGPPSII
jgi:hypothetical protein